MLKNFLLVIIYACTYQFVHVQFLFAHFDYMGYKYNPSNPIIFVFTLGLILTPLVLIRKLSGFLRLCFALLYLLLYIPVQITTFNHYSDGFQTILYQALFLLSFSLIFLIPLQTKSVILPVNAKKPKTKILSITCILILLILLYSFRSSFSIVGFDDVYGHRSEAKISSSFVSYLILWNTYLIGPLVLIQGLIKKKKWLVLLGIISVVSVYGMTASKISLFIPLVVIAVHYLTRKGEFSFNKMTNAMSAVMIIGYFISKKFFMISAILLMRTFGVSGLLTYQYAVFFEDHPQTFFSHVNFINYLTEWYAYKRPLGFEVGSFFVERDDYNANANFWATDGFAGLGAGGVLLVSIFVGLFLKLLKLVERTENARVLSLLIVPFCFIILNVSFFTSILSGGFIFVALYYIMYRV